MPEEEKEKFTVKDKRSSFASGEDTKGPETDPAPSSADLTGGPDAEQAAHAAREADKAQQSRPGGGPKIDFPTFVLSLSSSAAMSLGGYQDPQSGHIPRNLDMAKQTIDILSIIKEKTAGNLTPEEQQLLDNSLYELQMKYVEEVKKG